MKIVFKLIIGLGLLAGTVLLWLFYGLSWDGIDEVRATITGVETVSIKDCDIFDQKADNEATFYYNYTYRGKSYDGSYDICETNDGIKLHLKLHPIGSPVIIYLRPSQPEDSSVDNDDFTNKWCLGFGIVFSVALLLAFTYVSCCYEELSKELKEMFAEEVRERVGVGVNKII